MSFSCWATKTRPVFVAVMALVFSALPLLAQDSNAITAAGSGVVAPLAEAIAATSGASLSADVTGTSRGFELFCGGEVNLALSARPIAPEEEAACSATGVEFLELIAAYEGLMLVSPSEATFAECLTGADLNTLFAPSSQGVITDWSQVNLDNPSQTVNLVVPNADTPLYSLLDQQIEGDGLRTDVTAVASDADALAALSESPDALAVVSYNALAQAGESVRPLQLNTSAVGCVAPSPETFADRSYGAANALHFYANAADVAANTAFADFLTAVASDEMGAVIESSGFVVPPQTIREANRSTLETGNTGREFSRYVTAFQIPSGVFGTVTVGGSPSGADYVNRITTAFTSNYPSVTMTPTLLGETDGFRRFCNGEIDMVIAFNDLSEEQLANCAALNVVPVAFDLGHTAVVLLGNAGTPYLECLTTEHLGTLWAASDTLVTTWDQVDSTFPADPITLFAPESSGFSTDLLLLTTVGNQATNRVDSVVQVNPDPTWRGAATANVAGSLTYMTYADLQTVLESGQANVAPISVDAGSGCVAPLVETIADGSYPLTRPVKLIVSESALTRQEVQSVLWFMAEDERFSLLENNGIYGLAFSDLADLRNRLQDEFAAASAAQALPPVEVTPEATPNAESTAETTPEATSEATPASDPTAETTAQPGS
jgi:phosphate transport system substrate-binding protein